MKRALTHSEAASMLEAAAQGSLSEDDERAVLAHASNCPECGPNLVVLRARPAERIKSDKEVSIIAPPGVGRPAQRGFRGTPGESRLVVWYSVGATIIVVASVVLLLFVARDRSHLLTTNEILSDNQGVFASRLDSMSKALADDEALVASLTGPQVRVLALTAPSRAFTAKMFWDQATNRWTMFAHSLPAPRPGRTYQLWLVSKGTRISAGTFAPDANGDVVVRAQNALAADALDGITVTDEPAGGVTQPTGPVVMSATGK